MNIQAVGWGHEPDWYGSGKGKVAGRREGGYEPSGPIKFGEFHD
jgi:hypothetical protein